MKGKGTKTIRLQENGARESRETKEQFRIDRRLECGKAVRVRDNVDVKNDGKREIARKKGRGEGTCREIERKGR